MPARAKSRRAHRAPRGIGDNNMANATANLLDIFPAADDSAGIAAACVRLADAGWAPRGNGQWDALGTFTLWIEHSEHGRAAIGVNYNLRKYRDGAQIRYARTGAATRVARNYRAPAIWTDNA